MKHLSEESIMGLADGILTLSERVAAEAHIQTCSDCREQYNLYKSLDALLAEENVLKAPPVITNRVMQQVELHQKLMMRKVQSRNTLIRFVAIMFVFMITIIALAFISGAVIDIQTPEWITNIKNFFDEIKMPQISPMFLYVIIPVLFLLFTERIVYAVRRHKLAVH